MELTEDERKFVDALKKNERLRRAQEKKDQEQEERYREQDERYEILMAIALQELEDEQ